MRRFGLPALGILLTVAVLATTSDRSEGRAGDGSTTAMSALAASAPVEQVRVTVRNTLGGIPFSTRMEPIHYAEIGGEVCTTGKLFYATSEIDRWTLWPWRDSPPCNQRGVPIRICETFGIGKLCSEEFIFDGSDVLVHLEWSELVPEYLDRISIHVKFGHSGVSQSVTLATWSLRIGKFGCGGGGESFSATVPEFVSLWESSPSSVCGTPGSEVDYLFATEEFGDLSGSFIYEGTDITLEVDTGGLLETPTATAGPTSTPGPATAPATPRSLPATGGRRVAND